MGLTIFLFVTIISVVKGVNLDLNFRSPAIDESLHEDVLDAELCHEQIRLIRSNSALFIQFTDAGIRTPRGVAQGNFVDMGNYFQCLGINHRTDDMHIQGKYCTIQVPLSQNLTLIPRSMQWPEFDPSILEVDETVIAGVEEFKFQRAQMLAYSGVWNEDLSRTIPIFPNVGVTFRLAVCIPRPCSTQQAITSLLFNVSAVGFQYRDDFCRLPDDKPWSPADTVAVVFFSSLGVLTLLSTSYDLISTTILKKDPKQMSRLYTSFSAYTNGRRLMNFSSAPGALHCLDGIRIWAMLWVVIGHTFSTEGFMANPLDVYVDWLSSLRAIWITAAPITVDTFFCIAGILLVYTTVGKMNGIQLLKNLPLFYLNRLLRLWPLLAAAVLLQASFTNRILDGPYWGTVEDQTNDCRSNWWVTLLHVQNYVGVWTMCIPHSWYIAIDVHLYLVSPVVLYWVLGKNKKVAWAALVGGLLAVLTASSIYNFLNNFPSGTIAFHRPDIVQYFENYYFNTLTRASPFFVGMIFGYILHLYRGKKLIIPWMSVAILWTCAATISTTIFFYPYFIIQPYWDYQVVDNVMNSYMRAAWAAALCWMVVACTHGYGGPVNWFLTLDIWKLPARISYAIFIFHYPLMFVINGSAIAPLYFTTARLTFKALAHLSLSIVVAFFATLLIDAPFSTLAKLLLDRNKKKPVRPAVNQKIDTNEVESDKLEKNIPSNGNGTNAGNEDINAQEIGHEVNNGKNR